MQVGIWIRVSTEDQARGESPKNHEHRARMYAELKGWSVVELYDLSGVSGKTVLEHPEAKRMLADVSSGKIQALIFSKLARLARNVRELLDISDHFQKYNANLVSLEESIDTSTPAGRLLFTVIGALAQWEREEISARVAASVPIRARQGKPLGGKGSFGYMWVDKKFVLNPSEAPVVREMFHIFLDTRKLITTARIMNEKGYRTRNGAKFGKTTVKRILTDETYIGMKRANYSKSKGNKKSWILKPKSEWVYYEVEPIVSKEVWTEVNAIIKENAKPFPSIPPQIGKYVFSGLILCGDCNNKMYVMKYKGMKVPRYICRKCKIKINEDFLLKQFREGLKCMIISPEQLNSVNKTDESVLLAKENQLKVLKSEFKSIDKRIDNILDLVSDGSLDKRALSDKIRALQERKQQIEDEIPRLEGEIDYIKTYELGRNHILTQATTLYTLWDSFDAPTRTKIVRELINKIIINKDKLIFEFFYLSELMELCKSNQTHVGLDTFAYQPKFTLALPIPKELPKGYILNPKTVGEHIKKRRLDLGLLQIEVAKIIGVSEATIWNWEHGREPELRHIPNIIDFLGYTPFECKSNDTIEQLKHYKLVNGLSYEGLGKLMNRDPEQLTDWLSGRIRPCERNLKSIREFLQQPQ